MSLSAGLIAMLAAGAATTLSPAERGAVFRAAGFHQDAGRWLSGCGDPGTASYEPGKIEQVRDVNGDGRLEAIVTEGSTYCYGNTGTSFWLLSRQPNGHWMLLFNETGVATFLPTKGAGGWPDVEIGGPGFCFPIMRWNGRAYARHRFAYQGKPCKR